jgi:APA family basic amino acid/polyamine antiporter
MREVRAMSGGESDRARVEGGGLRRVLGAGDGALITIGAVIGTGIFITSADIVRVLPHGGLLLLVWAVGGLLTLAGALTYAELGVIYPDAGGIYTFLKEAYGPLWGFLYGWASFLVIMSGGVAALAVAFGIYFGSFFPYFAIDHVLVAVPLGGWTWTFSGGQLAAVGAIVLLTAVNYLGVREGAALQNLLTVLKVGAIVAFVGFGFALPARHSVGLAAPLPGLGLGALLTAFGVGMVAALWTYDGWYGLTFSAGEMRDPGRDLPVGLIAGCAIIMALYLGLNVVYLRALPIDAMAETPRIGESAAAALFGGWGGRAVAAAVVVSTFGCLSSTILYSSRIYMAMARDGVFFRSLAAVHPRFKTPGRSLWAQSGWALVLTVSGSYEQLYTYTVFAAIVFHVAAGAAVFVLRRKRPEAPRPYRVWGYPWVPALFIVATLILVGNTLWEKPVESLWGLGLVALGLPAYAWWRRGRRQGG